MCVPHDLAPSRQVEGINETIRQMEAYDAQMKSDIAVTRRETYGVEEAISKARVPRVGGVLGVAFVRRERERERGGRGDFCSSWRPCTTRPHLRLRAREDPRCFRITRACAGAFVCVCAPQAEKAKIVQDLYIDRLSEDYKAKAEVRPCTVCASRASRAVLRAVARTPMASPRVVGLRGVPLRASRP